VVAAEVKILSGQTREANIAHPFHVDTLSSQISQLRDHSTRSTSDAHGTHHSTLAMEIAIDRVGESLTELTGHNEAIKAEAAQNLKYCAATTDELTALERGPLVLIGKASAPLTAKLPRPQQAGAPDRRDRQQQHTDRGHALYRGARAMRARVRGGFENALATKAA